MLKTLPPSFADCLVIWNPQPPGTISVCRGMALPLHIVIKKLSLRLLLNRVKLHLWADSKRLWFTHMYYLQI